MAGGLGRPRGVFFAERALGREFSDPPLLPALTFTFPLLPPSSRSPRVWREPGQCLSENEDISQMACPSGCCWQAEPGGAGPDPWLSPKYPSYAPSLAAKPQQCLPPPCPPPPSALGPGVCEEIGRLQGPRGATAAKGGARPAWRPRVGTGHGWRVLPQLPTALAWPGRDARSDVAGGSVHLEGQASWPHPSSWAQASRSPRLLRQNARRSWPRSWLAGRLGIRSQARVWR